MSDDFIPFNVPYLTGKELEYIQQSHELGMLAGDGSFTRKCHEWLEKRTRTRRAMLTHSCTAALEAAALVLDLGPDDEVIMPSYTFVSTANAFALRGATPVFVDIREDTLNIDEKLIESAITPKTKAIAPVHYSGVSCEMDSILKVADDHGLHVIEDAAQGLDATYKTKPLGSMGTFGTLSFHETKNVISGEGGAILVNDENYVYDVEVAREKGTDRTRFRRGEVNKYTWQSLGSSYLPGELIAAFLWAQLQEASRITQHRFDSWSYYNDQLSTMELSSKLRRPIIPDECTHSGHMYYILLDEGIDRAFVLEKLANAGIGALFHYVPLHSSPAGVKYGRVATTMNATESLASRIIRLPMWMGITRELQDRVLETLSNVLKEC